MKKMWLFAVVSGFVLLMSANTVVAEQQESGAVGIWRFDEGQGTVVKDAGVNGNDGKIVNPEYAKWVEGKSGKGLEFLENEAQEGKNGCVVVRKLKSYDPSKGMTVEAWLKFNDKHSRKDAAFIANMGGWKGPGFRFIIAYDRLVFKSGDGKTLWGVASVSAKQGGFQNNRWYHLAGTYDGATYRVYVDGEEVAAQTDERGITTGDKSLSIGSYAGGTGSPIKGILDEVQIYNRARSAEEILRDAKLR